MKITVTTDHCRTRHAMAARIKHIVAARIIVRIGCPRQLNMCRWLNGDILSDQNQKRVGLRTPRYSDVLNS